MKRHLQIGILNALIWLLFPLALQATPVGKVTAIEGKVDLTASGKEAIPVIPGDAVNVGDIIRTKSKSRCEVTFIDGNILRLAESTRIQVSEYMIESNKRQETIGLLRGKIRSIVQKGIHAFGTERGGYYEVRTPTAVIGVRGSDVINFHLNGISGGVLITGSGYGYPLGSPQYIQNYSQRQGLTIIGLNLPPILQSVNQQQIDRHIYDTNIGGGSDGATIATTTTATTVAPTGSSFGTSTATTASETSAATTTATTTATTVAPAGSPSSTSMATTASETSTATITATTVQDIGGVRTHGGFTVGSDPSAASMMLRPLSFMTPMTTVLPITTIMTTTVRPTTVATTSTTTTRSTTTTTTVPPTSTSSTTSSTTPSTAPTTARTTTVLPTTTTTTTVPPTTTTTTTVPPTTTSTSTTTTTVPCRIPPCPPDPSGDIQYPDGTQARNNKGGGGTKYASEQISGATGYAKGLFTSSNGRNQGTYSSQLNETRWSKEYVVEAENGNLFHMLNLHPGRVSLPVASASPPGEGRIGTMPVAGAWMSINDSLTGISGGKLSYQGPDTGWQAVAAGSWIETNRFINMLSTAPGELDRLNIPRNAMGFVPLSGSGSGTNVNMTAYFYGYSSGPPRIWVASPVTGSTTLANPVTGTPIKLGGPGFVNNVDFTFTNWNSQRWAATVSTGSPGQIGGFSTQMRGYAAGTVGAMSGTPPSTTFRGTAAGIAAP